MPKLSKNSEVKASSLKHRDKRVNIPTEELCDFVERDEMKPKSIQDLGLL